MSRNVCITKRKASKGRTKYLVRWNIDGSKGSQSFDRVADARAKRAEIQESIRAGRYVDPKGGRRTFEEWAWEVQRMRADLRDTTLERDEILLRRHILPTFGPLPLADIRRLKIERWLTNLADRYSPKGTPSKALELTSRILEAAVGSELLAKNPAKGIRRPKGTPTEKRFLDESEVRQLADAMPAHLRALVIVAAGTGLRLGELFALRLSRVDMLRRQLRVEEISTEPGGHLSYGPPKTRASRRIINLPDYVIADLAAHMATFRPGIEAGDLIFTGELGSPLRRSNFYRLWRTAVKASVGAPCTPHDLRHTHAAQLIREGVHAKAIQVRLGHTSITTTLDIYGHLFGEVDTLAAAALDRAWARAQDEHQMSTISAASNRVGEAATL